MKKLLMILSLVFTVCSLTAQDEGGPFTWKITAPAPDQLEVRAELPEGAYFYQQFTIVTPKDSERITLETLPDTVLKHDEIMGDIAVYPAPSAVWRYKVAPDAASREFVIDYQGCTTIGEGAACFMPVTITLAPNAAAEKIDLPTGSASFDAAVFFAGYEVVDSAGGYMNAETFSAFIEGQKEADMFADKNLWVAILLALIVGLGLNLTPCVLPMLPITLSIIGAGAVATNKKTGFIRGGAYALGMALTYGTLGLLAALAGTQFGTLNSSPWFNIAIAVVFVILAVAMFDLIHIDFSRYSAKFDARGLDKGRLIGVFFLGIVTALLAGACVAPALIAALIYTAQNFAAGNWAVLIVPFMLGIGMALPWPFAGAGLSVLPQPGMWMNKVKFAFGLLILVMAGYYGYTAYRLFNPIVLPAGSDGASAFTAAKATGKPIVIDFWATWCGSCNEMSRSVLPDEKVVKALEGKVLVKWQAEDPKNPDTREVMRYFNITTGLPAFVILKPKQ